MTGSIEDIPNSAIRFLAECAGKGPDWPEIKKRQAHRLLMMLRNGSPRALRLAGMYDRGEMSGDQLLEIVWEGKGVTR